MRQLRSAMVLSFLLCVQTCAHACLWDRDTMEQETKRFPEAVQVITGRFERNPPLFYEMRLKRVAAEIQRKPDDLALYDDAGVACDRLGRDDEALQWMAKKRVQLVKRDPIASNMKDHWYRYYADTGTFHVHHWF